MDRYIVGIGDILWDCLPEGRKIGGAPANFAYYTKQFGYDSMVVSAVGNDVLGMEILSLPIYAFIAHKLIVGLRIV